MVGWSATTRIGDIVDQPRHRCNLINRHPTYLPHSCLSTDVNMAPQVATGATGPLRSLVCSRQSNSRGGPEGRHVISRVTTPCGRKQIRQTEMLVALRVNTLAFRRCLRMKLH